MILEINQSKQTLLLCSKM